MKNIFAEGLASGRAMTVSDYVALAPSGTRKIMLVTPVRNADIYFALSVYADASVTVAFYEGADRTAGTALTPINRKRGAAFTGGVTVSRTPTGGTTDGTLLFSHTTQTGGIVGDAVGGAPAQSQIIRLRGARKYVVLLTAGASNVNVTTHLHWVEVPATWTTTTTSTTSSTSSSSSSSSTSSTSSTTVSSSSTSSTSSTTSSTTSTAP